MGSKAKNPNRIAARFLQGGYPGDDITNLNEVFEDLPPGKRKKYKRFKKRLKKHLVELQRWDDD